MGYSRFKWKDDKIIITFSVHIFGATQQIIGVMALAILSDWLSESIADIVVGGQTGACYLSDSEGTIIADRDKKLVVNIANVINNAKKDSSSVSVANFLSHAIKTLESEVGYYDYKGDTYIGSFAKVGSAGWTVVVRVPQIEELIE